MTSEVSERQTTLGLEDRSRPLVAMVVRNAVVHDARVIREAETLAQQGYRVVVFGLKTDAAPSEEQRGGVRIVRVTPQWAMLTLMMKLLAWPRNLELRYKRFAKRVGRIRRGIIARLRRLWCLLREESDRSGVRAAVRSARGKARTLAVAIVYFPLLALRALFRALTGKREVAVAPPVVPIHVPQPRLAFIFKVLSRLFVLLFHGASVGARAWAFQRTVGRSMAAERPAVYHCHDFHTIWAGRIASRRWPAPYVYDAHEIYAHQNLPRFTRRRRVFVTIAEWLAVRRATAVITVNDSLARWLARRYRAAAPIVVRNIPASRAVEQLPEIPEPLLQPGTKILYVGTLTFGRGLENSIRALSKVSDASLIMMGPGQPRFVEELRTLAEEVGVADRLHIVPPVPHGAVVQVASHATVGLVVGANVCLSYYLSLPNKVFEYMHAGVPIVGSDFPEIRAVVEGYGLGRTCDPADPDAIATAIASVVSDREEYARMCQNARTAASAFKWEAEAEKLRALYARLAPLPATR